MPVTTTSFLKAKPRRPTSSSAAQAKPASSDSNSAAAAPKVTIRSSVAATFIPAKTGPNPSDAESVPTEPKQASSNENLAPTKPTIRFVPSTTLLLPNAEHGSGLSVRPSNRSLAAAPSFENAKAFWDNIDNDNRCGGTRSASVSVPKQNVSKPDVASSKGTKGTAAPKAPKTTKTSQIPKASFNAKKTFWGQLEMGEKSEKGDSSSGPSGKVTQPQSQHVQTPKRQDRKRYAIIELDSSPFISTPESNF